MPLVVQDLLASKKFVFVLVITVLILAAMSFGVLTKPEAMSLLGVIWPVYLGAQGVADVGQKLAESHILVNENSSAHAKLQMEQLTQMIPSVATLLSNMQAGADSPKVTGEPPKETPAEPTEVPAETKKEEQKS